MYLYVYIHIHAHAYKFFFGKSHLILSKKWENREMIGKDGQSKHESKWSLSRNTKRNNDSSLVPFSFKKMGK